MKFKLFLLMGLTAWAGAQGYFWLNDTSFSQEKEKMIEAKDRKIQQTKQDINDFVDNKIDQTKESLQNTLGISHSPKSSSLPIPTVLQKQKDNTHLIKPVEVLYVVKYKYDSTNKPDGVSDEKMLSLIQKSAQTIERSCGVQFVYEGMTRSDYMGGENGYGTGKDYGVIRWSELSDDTLGQANLGDKNGPVTDFIMDLNTNSFLHENGKLDENYLQSTILHELGHVIGLPHSRLPQSIMYFENRNSTDELNDGDRQMCQETIAQWEKNPQNKKIALKK